MSSIAQNRFLKVSLLAAFVALPPQAAVIAHAEDTGLLSLTASSKDEIRHQLASDAWKFEGAETGSFLGEWKHSPEYWLMGIAVLGLLGEAGADHMTEISRQNYLANPTNDRFDKTLFWQGTRNTFPFIYFPAGAVGIAWWAGKRLHGTTAAPAAPLPPESSAAKTSAPAKPAEPVHGKQETQAASKPITTVAITHPASTSAPVAKPTAVPTPTFTFTFTHTFTPTPVPPTPTVAIAKTSPREEAKAHFEKGIQLYKMGNKLGANFEFTQCQEIDPTYPDVQKWIEKINQEVSAPKQPAAEDAMGSQQEKVIQSHLRQAQDFYAHGEYKKAIAEYKLVLELVNNSKQVAEKLAEAEQKMKEALDHHVSQARQYREEKKLKKEIDEWTAALRIDDENLEVKHELDSAKERIPDEANRLYRAALDLYSQEKIEEAVNMWHRVLELDPSHERTLNLLPKAERKLEELKASKVGQ